MVLKCASAFNSGNRERVGSGMESIMRSASELSVREAEPDDQNEKDALTKWNQTSSGEPNCANGNARNNVFKNEDIPPERCRQRNGCCGRGCDTRSHLAVFCAFSIMFLVVGIMSSFGVFYVELLDYYGDGSSYTSLIGSINSGVSHAAGPLVGLIESKIGIRKTVVVGGILSAIGMTGSSFVPSLFSLYFTYGVISGTGFAIAYTASIGMLASHFNCQRSLDIAVGISTSGMGFGVLALPPLIRVMIDAYGWRGTMLICSGIVLNVCVFAALSGSPKRKTEELIRSLSMCSLAYIRTEKNILRRDIISMSMTSIYVMKDAGEQESSTPATTSTHTSTRNNKTLSTKITNNASTTNCKPTAVNGCNGEVPRPADSVGNKSKKSPICTILSNKPFLILLVSEVLSNMTINTVLTTLPYFAHQNGHSLFHASLLLSIFGTTATIGRLYLSLFSAASRSFKSNKRVTIATAGVLTTVSVLCMGLTGQNYYLIGFWVALFGLATGAKGTFVYCFVIKLLGVENTITVAGLVSLSCGIGQFGGPPIAGSLYSCIGWYPVVYCFGAVTSLLAVLLVIVIIVLHIRDRKRKEKLTEHQLSTKIAEEGSLL